MKQFAVALKVLAFFLLGVGVLSLLDVGCERKELAEIQSIERLQSHTQPFGADRRLSESYEYHMRQAKRSRTIGYILIGAGVVCMFGSYNVEAIGRKRIGTKEKTG
jgi:hypothetical protein